MGKRVFMLGVAGMGMMPLAVFLSECVLACACVRPCGRACGVHACGVRAFCACDRW